MTIKALHSLACQNIPVSKLHQMLAVFKKLTSNPAAGGPGIIMKYAGKDATEAYEPIHPPNTLDTYLPKDKHLGQVDMDTVEKVIKERTEEEKELDRRRENKPPLHQCMNLYDFESVSIFDPAHCTGRMTDFPVQVAKTTLPPQA